ncbi:MAG: PepSY domain-containing protein [Geminicoccaceae bacterium]
MLKSLTAALLLTTVISAQAFASDGVVLNDENKAHIKEMLTEQGYEVGKIKTEDGLYEAYAKKDGKRYEVFLDASFEIVRTEEDD